MVGADRGVGLNIASVNGQLQCAGRDSVCA